MKRKNAFFNLDLEGLEKLEKELNQLPARLRNKILRKSLTKATDLVKNEAIQNAPHRKPATGWMAFIEDPSRPSLRDNIVSKVTVTQKRVWGRVGIDYKKVKWGHIIEFGARPHWVGEKWHNRWQHPGIAPKGGHSPAQPFMRPAYESKGEQAVNMMANDIYDAIFGKGL